MANTRVLITNDDGVDSPGIHALARHVERAGHEVIVVAPDHDASGTGASLGRISPDHPIALTETSIDGLRARVYAIGGPPALCVMAANLEAFAERPDIVVSGINAGLNTGRSALHSGTIGAALAAQNFGLRALSVSLARSEPWHWETAAALAVDVLPAVIDGPDRGLLNLNVPGVPRENVRGILWTGLATFKQRSRNSLECREQQAPLRIRRDPGPAGKGHGPGRRPAGICGSDVHTGHGGSVGPRRRTR